MTERIKRVIVTWSGYRDRILERSRREGFEDLEFIISDDKDEIVSGLVDTDVAFIGAWDADMLRAGPKLRLIHAIGGGVRQNLFPEMVESGVPFTCGKPAFAIPGAEFAIGSMLMFSRRNHVTVGSPKLTQRSPSREAALRPADLAGKTLGVLGMGGIGQALAPRAKAMGMRVVGTSRRSREAPDGVDRMYSMGEAVDMFAECDFVAVAVPETAETEGIVSEGLLTKLKRGAFILDCSGRPSHYDYGALNRALSSGRLGGVCFQPAGESPGMSPDDSDFWKRDNVVVTTCRGTSSEQEDLCVGLLFENLRRLESGRTLLGLVDKTAGY